MDYGRTKMKTKRKTGVKSKNMRSWRNNSITPLVPHKNTACGTNPVGCSLCIDIPSFLSHILISTYISIFVY